MDNLEMDNVHSNKQFGFPKGRSTKLALFVFVSASLLLSVRLTEVIV